MLAFMPGTRLFFALCFAAALLLLIVVPLGGRRVRRARCLRRRGAGLRRVEGVQLRRMPYPERTGLGIGKGSYAPDLTRIYSARGENYLRARFWSTPARSIPMPSASCRGSA
ncbi:MAG: hypothetical protein U0521_20365 [Anaerolineae bacterium]